jgi:hypothetical protein
MSWTREWLTGPNASVVKVQTLNYADEFAAPPVVSVDPETKLRLQLRGKGTAKFWKDWVVSRLIPDLKSQFPGIGELLCIRDCT